MRKTQHHIPTCASTAIAAVLALSSTSLFAQQAPPTTTDPAPAVSAQPAPAVETAPVTPDTTATPEPTVETTATKRTVSKHTVRTAAKVNVPATPKTATRVTTTQVTRAAVPAVAVRPATAPAAESPAAPATGPGKPAPIVDLTAKSAPTAAPAAAKPAGNVDDAELTLGGGALALLALGAGAYALMRRRRADEPLVNDEMHEEWMEDQHVEPAPRPMFEDQPAIVAPKASAFAWGDAQPCKEPSDDGSDRCPGESWVERAYRGPSPANPSVSLKARLRRAAFFDKRERDVAAGTAEPVEPDAGLPETMVEEQERELA